VSVCVCVFVSDIIKTPNTNLNNQAQTPAPTPPFRCNDVCASSCGRCCIMITPTVIGCYATATALQNSSPLPLPPEAALASLSPVLSMCMHPHVPHVIAALADGR
jgi:hypothetical protein